jgi:DNA helicase-2/ATP-dependent DNA helicase PcrA
LTGLADEESLDEPGAHVERSRLAEFRGAFKALGFEERTLARLDTGEPMAELPFVLELDGRLIRGRIDAVYEAADGGIEIVDFKTGAEFEPEEPDQLLLYAAALSQLGIPIDGPITLTYCYLATGNTKSRTIEVTQAEGALETIRTALRTAV